MDTYTEKQLNIIRNNVKAERVRCGYTQEDLAKVLAISKSAYSKLEQGQRTFSLEHLITISNFLNVELPSLLKQQAKKEDILNQSEEKRKEFFKELLMTFGIGAKPQKEYTMREISAVITFLRAYGHTLPYTPNKLKKHMFYTGKISSEITASIEEIVSLYEKGLPEKYSEVAELLKQEQDLKRNIIYLHQQLTALQEKNKQEASPTLNQYQIEINSKRGELSLLNSRIASEEKKLSNLIEESRQYERTIELHKKTVAAIERSKQTSSDSMSTENNDSELQQKYDQLLIEKEELLKELDKAYEDYDMLAENTSQSEIDNLISEGIDDYVAENYHSFTGEDFEVLVDNLLFFAMVYATIRRKYKSVSDDPYQYTKASIIREYVEYNDLIDISSVLKMADDSLDWELEYGSGKI